MSAATLVTIEELSRRWHKAHTEIAERRYASDSVDSFTVGRMEGYLQAIAVLLNTPASAVRAALEEGRL